MGSFLLIPPGGLITPDGAPSTILIPPPQLRGQVKLSLN